MEHAVEDIVDIAYKVYENQDVQLAREIEPLEEVIDELSKELKYRHIQRLRAGECTIEMGFILSDVTTSPDETFYRELELIRRQYQLPTLSEEIAKDKTVTAGA